MPTWCIMHAYICIMHTYVALCMPTLHYACPCCIMHTYVALRMPSHCILHSHFLHHARSPTTPPLIIPSTLVVWSMDDSQLLHSPMENRKPIIFPGTLSLLCIPRPPQHQETAPHWQVLRFKETSLSHRHFQKGLFCLCHMPQLSPPQDYRL